MAVLFPTSLDNGTSLPNPTATSDTNNPSLSAGQDLQNTAIIAVETKLGTGASTPTSGNLLAGTGTGTSSWSVAYPAGTIVGTTDIQTLTNKTLTSPTINSPTISNPTITGGLGSLTTSTLTASGLITANAGITTTGFTVSGGTVTFQPGTVASTSLTNPYKFSAHIAGSYNTSTSGAVTPFDTNLFDTSSNFSTSTHLFTAPIAGFYSFSWTVNVNPSGAGAINTWLILSGDAHQYNGSAGSDTSNINISVGTKVVQLSSGQTVGCYTSTGSSVSFAATTSANYWCIFSGFLVSEA